MGWLINPYDEPPDPHDENDHGVDRLTLVVGSVPLLGAGVAVSALGERQTGFLGVRRNPRNRDNTTWNAGLLTVSLQLCYLALVVVFLT